MLETWQACRDLDLDLETDGQFTAPSLKEESQGGGQTAALSLEEESQGGGHFCGTIKVELNSEELAMAGGGSIAEGREKGTKEEHAMASGASIAKRKAKGKAKEEEHMDAGLDTDVKDMDISRPLLLRQRAGPHHMPTTTTTAIEGEHGMMREEFGTPPLRSHYFVAKTPRQEGGVIRFIASCLRWIWSSNFVLGPLMILVGPKIWVRLLLLLVPLCPHLLNIINRLVPLVWKYGEFVTAFFWNCFNAWWPLALESSFDRTPTDFGQTRGTMWRPLAVTCDQWTVTETLPCPSAETIVSTLTVSTVLTLSLVSILHSSDLTPISTMTIAIGLSDVVVLTNAAILPSTSSTLISSASTSFSQISYPIEIEIEVASSFSSNVCPFLLFLPWTASLVSLPLSLSASSKPGPRTAALLADTTTESDLESGSEFVIVCHPSRPGSRSTPTASVPSQTVTVASFITPPLSPPTPAGPTPTASKVQPQDISAAKGQSPGSLHSRRIPIAFPIHWQLLSNLLAILEQSFLFLVPFLVRVLFTALLRLLPCLLPSGDGNRGKQRLLPPTEALMHEIYSGAGMVGQWVDTGFD